jgi:hypothetical protein
VNASVTGLKNDQSSTKEPVPVDTLSLIENLQINKIVAKKVPNLSVINTPDTSSHHQMNFTRNVNIVLR